MSRLDFVFSELSPGSVPQSTIAVRGTVQPDPILRPDNN